MPSDGNNTERNWKVCLYSMYQPIFEMICRRKHFSKALSIFPDSLGYAGFLIWIPKEYKHLLSHLNQYAHQSVQFTKI